MVSVVKCMSTSEESELCERIHRSVGGDEASLLLGETRRIILVTPPTVLDDQALASRYPGRPLAWLR